MNDPKAWELEHEAQFIRGLGRWSLADSSVAKMDRGELLRGYRRGLDQRSDGYWSVDELLELRGRLMEELVKGRR